MSHLHKKSAGTCNFCSRKPPHVILLCISISTYIRHSQAECEEFKIDYCYMHINTTINRPDFEVTSIRSETQGFYFSDNKKIFHLPVKLYKTFPKLFMYRASNCSIREVSKKHFERLSILGELCLDHNQITTINGDTFRGLISLWLVNLGHKHIFLKSI